MYSTSGVAKDIHIYPNKPAGIQTAFNNALSGDRIVLHKGDYFEILRLTNKSNISIVASRDGAIKIYGVTLGVYNKKEFSPINSSFYNNAFLSDGLIANYTGFAEDGIDIDNNVFCTLYKNINEGLLFKGWNGSNNLKRLSNNNEWANDTLHKLDYNRKKGNFKWCRKSKKALSKFKLKPLPLLFPENDIFNKRIIPEASF